MGVHEVLCHLRLLCGWGDVHNNLGWTNGSLRSITRLDCMPITVLELVLRERSLVPCALQPLWLNYGSYNPLVDYFLLITSACRLAPPGYFDRSGQHTGWHCLLNGTQHHRWCTYVRVTSGQYLMFSYNIKMYRNVAMRHSLSSERIYQ